MDDVFGKRPQVQQLFAFFLEFLALPGQRLREQVRQISNGEKSKQVPQEPEAQRFTSRDGGGRAGNFSNVDKRRYSAQQKETE